MGANPSKTGIADKVIQNVISRKITNKIKTKTVDDEVGYVVQITKTVWVPTKYTKVYGYDRNGKYVFKKY